MLLIAEYYVEIAAYLILDLVNKFKELNNYIKTDQNMIITVGYI